MKKIDLGQAIGILANVGVIVGIAFLAVEINQNNELLRAEARRDQLDVRTSATRLGLSSSELIDVRFKVRAGEELTPKEEFIAGNLDFLLVRSWEWQYGEFAAGILQEDELPFQAWRAIATDNPRLREVWQLQATSLDPGFVSFMNERVFSE